MSHLHKDELKHNIGIVMIYKTGLFFRFILSLLLQQIYITPVRADVQFSWPITEALVVVKFTSMCGFLASSVSEDAHEHVPNTNGKCGREPFILKVTAGKRAFAPSLLRLTAAAEWPGLVSVDSGAAGDPPLLGSCKHGDIWRKRQFDSSLKAKVSNKCLLVTQILGTVQVSPKCWDFYEASLEMWLREMCP